MTAEKIGKIGDKSAVPIMVLKAVKKLISALYRLINNVCRGGFDESVQDNMKRLTLGAALLAMLIASIVGAQVVGSRTTSAPGITRRVMVDERTVQVVRSTYQPGAVEPPGPHSFDVVIVPLSPGTMEVTVAGKSIPWKSGEAFFIGRGVEHRLANDGKTAVDFLSIRVP